MQLKDSIQSLIRHRQKNIEQLNAEGTKTYGKIYHRSQYRLLIGSRFQRKLMVNNRGAIYNLEEMKNTCVIVLAHVVCSSFKRLIELIDLIDMSDLVYVIISLM